MRWQEAWIHPRAYGFRLARGAVDAATVTQVLLELARLKGWRLEGLSLDYVKCFDLIPQAVVLRIARELGMDDGVLRALAAMYRQLRRAFRLAGALGAWWQATNGILQGCPLSVILINLLTTAWKMEIDTMRRHVVVTTHLTPAAPARRYFAAISSISVQVSIHPSLVLHSSLPWALNGVGVQAVSCAYSAG